MTFSKAIQIKGLVNRWNQERKSADYGYIKFECEMFSIGKWSVDLSAVGAELFFSDETEQLLTLHAGGGFHMRISAFHNVPVICIQ